MLFHDFQVEAAIVSYVEKLVMCQKTVLVNLGVVVEGVVVEVATNVGTRAIWLETAPLLGVEARAASTVAKMDICQGTAQSQEVKAEASLATTVVGMVICQRIVPIPELMAAVEVADLVEIEEVMLCIIIL